MGTEPSEPRRSKPDSSLRGTKARRRQRRGRSKSAAAAPESRRAAHTSHCGARETIASSRCGLTRVELRIHIRCPIPVRMVTVYRGPDKAAIEKSPQAPQAIEGLPHGGD